jgi:hypothetical protein
MLDTMTRYLSAITDSAFQRAIRYVVKPSIDRLSSQTLMTPGIIINNTGSVFPRLSGASAYYAVAGGKLVTLPAGTGLGVPVGVAIPAGYFGIVCIFIDSSGTTSILAGTPGATLAAATWPQFPTGQALVGALIITGAGAFVGGTTPLDTGTTIYLNPVGAFDPTALV